MRANENNTSEERDEQSAHIAAPAAAAQPSDPELSHLTTKEAIKDIAQFWPFVLRFGIISAAQAVETLIIAQAELDYVAAYAAYQSLIGLSIGLLYSSIFPVVTLISGAAGEEADALKRLDDTAVQAAREKVQKIWRQGVIFASILSAIAITFATTASPLFKLFNQPDVVTKHSRDYMLYAASGFAADVFYRLTARTVTGLGVKKSILIADSLDVTMEAALAYLFLNGKLGLPKFGIEGVGLAYSISKTITFLGHLAYLFASTRYKPYHLFQWSRPFFDKDTLKQLVAAGIPDGMSSVLSGISAMLVVMFCGQSGTAPLVGIQAASIYHGFANFHMSAVLNAACNKIGRYYEILKDEEDKYTRETKIIAAHNVKQYTKLLFVSCFFLSMIACGLTFLIPKQLASVLVDENDATHQAHHASIINFLQIQGAFEIIGGLGGAANCVLDALLDNRFLFIMTVVFDLITNPSAAATMHYGFHKDANWVYAASGFGGLLMTVGFLMRCYSKLHQVNNDSTVENSADTRAIPMPPANEAANNTSMMQRLRHMIWPAKNDSQDPRQPLLASAAAPAM